MLANFNARNFRNFKKWMVFSLETPDAYAFNKEAVYNGVIKDAVIIGHNACGKTDLGIAVIDITTHLTDWEKSSCYQQWAWFYLPGCNRTSGFGQAGQPGFICQVCLC